MIIFKPSQVHSQCDIFVWDAKQSSQKKPQHTENELNMYYIITLKILILINILFYT